ncbi:MAG: hypothetical protein QOF78_4620 [Phycisphaerales bacterium]|jgi:hypothetical protein|nr:hypothetical protein [Phycisphaerales bacterium]
MSRHSINLPPELEAKVATRAAESGHATIEEYLESLVRADADDIGEDYGAPEHLRVTNEAQLEQLLAERLDDDQPLIEATPELWEGLRNRVRAKRGGGAGAP